MKQENKTIQELLPLAEAGNAKAQFELGNLYDSPDNTSSHEACRQALLWYEKAAAQNYPQAAEHAGYVILHGLAGDIDHARALKWLLPAAEAGSGWASQMIANSYFRGQGTPSDPDKAFPWFEKAARQGFPEGIFRTGYAYAKGLGTARSESKAAEWFRKGAEAGNSPSHACLGAMAWGGLGRERDYSEAKYRFEQAMASTGGNSWAPFMLGVMSENGQGVPRDLKQAETFYEQAAKGGYYQAKIRLDLLLLSSAKAPLYNEDPKWLIQGAEKGNPLDQFVLGLLYAQGMDGRASDKEKALLWSELASDHHITAAAELSGTLRKQLPAETLRRVDAQMKELREKFKKQGLALF